jgi:hypothetical protein
MNCYVGIMRFEDFQEIGGSNRNGIAPETANKGIRQQTTAHEIAPDNHGHKCRPFTSADLKGFLLLNRLQ